MAVSTAKTHIKVSTIMKVCENFLCQIPERCLHSEKRPECHFASIRLKVRTTMFIKLANKTKTTEAEKTSRNTFLFHETFTLLNAINSNFELSLLMGIYVFFKQRN